MLTIRTGYFGAVAESGIVPQLMKDGGGKVGVAVGSTCVAVDVRVAVAVAVWVGVGPCEAVGSLVDVGRVVAVAVGSGPPLGGLSASGM